MRIQFTITDFTNHQSCSLIYPNNFINYQDDYILTNLDTNRVDTCNKYQMHAYLEQALPDIYRILLNRK